MLVLMHACSCAKVRRCSSHTRDGARTTTHHVVLDLVYVSNMGILYYVIVTESSESIWFIIVSLYHDCKSMENTNVITI